MGYTTQFMGKFTLDRPLDEALHDYLKAFNTTRRMQRDASKVALLDDPKRLKAGLPVGVEGAYFVGAEDDYGQAHTEDILDYNRAPEGQPGLWCGWVPSKDRTAIEWDGAEKFYSYVEWLQYLIKNFLAPKGYTLNGEVTWSGEEDEDRGILGVKDNRVYVRQAVVTFTDPEYL